MLNFFLSCKELRIEPTAPKTYYGCFCLGPFENGQALTVANALRRTLLSEISGLAITSAKVNNVFHEYSTLTGVRETVLDILLNLKEISLTKNSAKPMAQTQFGYLQARGPGILRAVDLKLPPMIHCVDPDQYIATLTEDGFLNLKFKIDEGKNFRVLKNPLDFSSFHTGVSSLDETYLAIDPVFTPIKKVNYTIESNGAESIEKANQVVILEVWTNGGISPKEAVSQTLNYLRVLFNGLGQLKMLQSFFTAYSLTKNQKFQHVLKKTDNDLDLLNFSFPHKPFVQLNNQQSPLEILPSSLKTNLEEFYVEEINNQTRQEWEKRSINDLGLPFRIFNCFYKAKIQTVGQILELNSKELKKIPGFGNQSLLILRDILKLTGLSLKEG